MGGGGSIAAHSTNRPFIEEMGPYTRDIGQIRPKSSINGLYPAMGAQGPGSGVWVDLVPYPGNPDFGYFGQIRGCSMCTGDTSN